MEYHCRIKTVTMMLRDKPDGYSFWTPQGVYKITNLYPITNFNDNYGVMNEMTYVRYSLVREN